MELKTYTCPEDQYSQIFLQGMVDRMSQGFHKYRKAKDNIEANWIDTLKLRLQEYEKTGNTEWLMDIANYAMCEFMYPRHSEAHYRATESNESPGFVTNDGHRRTTSVRGAKPTFHRHEGD